MSNREERWKRLQKRRPAWLAPRLRVIQFCCAALLAVSGCTTLETVESPAGSGLEAGDTVAVSLRDGRRLELSFVEWTEDRLAGTDSEGTLHRIPDEDIAQLEVERHSLLGNIGLGVVVLATAVAVLGDSSDY